MFQPFWESRPGTTMKIAIVCPYAWDRVGGVQSHVRALGRTLRGRGHNVQILAPSSMTLTHQLAGGEDVKLVGRAVGVPANGSVAPLAFGPLAATGIRMALRDYEPDVVHLHEPLVPSLSLLALLNTKVPTVGTFHAAREGEPRVQRVPPDPETRDEETGCPHRGVRRSARPDLRVLPG